MSARCPCSSGDVFDACCAPHLNDVVAAPTAEKLMRSRYSAFSVGNAGYLRRSWHPDTVPAQLDLDPEQRWYRLDIHSADAGGLFDAEGTVEFSARYKHPAGNGILHELSRFVRFDGCWVYLDGTIGV